MEFNYDDITYMKSEQRKAILKDMGSSLTQNLPKDIIKRTPYVFAIGQFLDTLLIDTKIFPRNVFGFMHHDVVICIIKGWRIPAAMLLGLIYRALDPFCQYFYGFDKNEDGTSNGEYTVYSSTLGFIDSIMYDLIEGKDIDSWKLWYMRGIAVYFTAYGDRNVPGMNGCLSRNGQIINNSEVYVMPKCSDIDFSYYYIFDLDGDKINLKKKLKRVVEE